MSKTKRVPSTTSSINERDSRIAAADKFSQGDRVRHRITGRLGTFASIHSGFAVPECWIDFDTDTETGHTVETCNPLDLEMANVLEPGQFSLDPVDSTAVEVQEILEQLQIEGLEQSECLPSSMLLPESEAFPLQPETSVESKPLNSAKSTHSANQSSVGTSPKLKSSMTSAALTPLDKLGTSPHADSHVRISQPPTPTEEDSQAIAQDSTGNSCELSEIQDPDSLLSKTSPICAIEDLLRSSTVLPKSGTWDLTSLWEQDTLERPTLEKGCSWLPTPMSYSRGLGKRRAGQTKLDLRLRADGHLPKEEVLDPAVPQWMMGFPDGWLDVESVDGGEPPPPPQPVELPDVEIPTDIQNSKQLETQSHPELPRSPSDESSISTTSQSEIIEQELPDALLTTAIGRSEHHISFQSSDMNNFTTATDASICAETTVVPELDLSALEENNLSPNEEADRHRLELRVERAFYESGTALRELCNRRLYRSTHKTFEAYAKERFGLDRRYCYRLIDAVQVVENLWPIGPQIENRDTKQLLPSAERQVRDLVGLEPQQQRKLWQEAVEEAGGIPSGRIVKEVVERYKQKDTPPPPILFKEGDAVMIRGMGNPDLRGHDGRWAIALRINEYSVTISLDGKDVPVKPQFLEPLDPECWTEIKVVWKRIDRLFQCDLDPADDAVLELLKRRTSFTDRQKLLLHRMELDYGLVAFDTSL